MKMDLKVPVITIIAILFLSIFFLGSNNKKIVNTEPTPTPLPKMIERSSIVNRDDVRLIDYTNSTFGFKFSYPDTFLIEEKKINTNTMASTCPGILQINITNPKTPLLYYDLNSSGSETLANPRIELALRKANCGKADSPAVMAKSDVVQSLLNTGIYTNVVLSSVSSIIGHTIPSLDNQTGKTKYMWNDDCEMNLVLTTLGQDMYLKNKICTIDTNLGAQTQILFPFKSKEFFIDMRAQKIYYDDSGYIDLISNSISEIK